MKNLASNSPKGFLKINPPKSSKKLASHDRRKTAGDHSKGVRRELTPLERERKLSVMGSSN
jgi:hypothetical protein